ncbi:MAG: DUF3107 domain-containing protein [Actinomycetota bacterium]
MIEVRIGVIDVPKELTIELENDPEEVVEKVNAALGGEADMLWLIDSRGKQVGVSVAKIAYLEVEPERSRRVGFGAE